MKKIGVRINKTFEYEVFFEVPDGMDEQTVKALAFALEGADLTEMHKNSWEDQCKLIAEYNDLVNWDVVE